MGREKPDDQLKIRETHSPHLIDWHRGSTDELCLREEGATHYFTDRNFCSVWPPCLLSH
jgi:hypothetical protein